MTPLLAGIRIVDLTSVVMGPFATYQLGALGADVIKVEPPGGESVRHIAPARHPGMGGMFLNVNRDKRSLVLDLKMPEARAALDRVLATADVLVHNMRRPAARRGRGTSTHRPFPRHSRSRCRLARCWAVRARRFRTAATLQSLAGSEASDPPRCSAGRPSYGTDSPCSSRMGRTSHRRAHRPLRLTE